MHERRFNRDIERLRDPDRIERLEVERVVCLSLENLADVRTVLDIGTGTGLFAEQFAKKGLAVAGLDVKPEMLAAAQKFVPTGVFREGIAEKLPFSDGSFDLVFMGLLLHETDNALAAMREARRVATRRLSVLEWPKEAQPFGPPLEDRLDSDQIVKLARQAGFTLVEPIRLESLALYLID